MAGPPVVISTNGRGLPVRQVTSGAPVLTVASNGFGVPIVLTNLGAPFIIEGAGPPVNPITGTDPHIYDMKEGDTLGLYVEWGDYGPAGASVSKKMQVDGGAWMDYDEDSTFTEGQTVLVRAEVTFGVWNRTYTSNIVIVSGEVPSTVFYGFNANTDEGVSGDWFVSVSGSDAGAGTVADPFRTIGKAISVALPDQEIKVRAGVYRETANLSGKSNITISRYADEQAVISGREPLTGLVACTAADAGVVGAKWVNLFKVTMPVASFQGSPQAAFICEAGESLPLASVKVPFPFRPMTNNDTSDWINADETVLGTGNVILGYRSAQVTSKYSESQISAAKISFVHDDNRASTVDVAGVDDGVILLSDQTKVYESNASRDKFALLNMPAAIKKGQWAYVVSGTDVTLYVWPNNTANIPSGVEYSARAIGVNMLNAGGCSLRGMVIEGTASDSPSTDGNYAIALLHSVVNPKVYGINITNCLIRDTWRSSGGYAPIAMRRVQDSVFRNLTILNAIGQYGVVILGGEYQSTAGMDSGIAIEFCKFERVDSSVIRSFGIENSRFAYNLAVDCAWATHANKSNAYLSARNNLWYANYFHASGGYFTWQEASSQHVLFNVIPSGTGDGRSVVDQNRSSGSSPATVDGVVEVAYITNNLLPPYVSSLSATNGLTAGKAHDPYAHYSVLNNIINGAVTVPEYIDEWESNALTSGSVISPSDALTSQASVYESLATGDYRIKADSPTWSMSAAPLSDVFDDLRLKHPNAPYIGKDLAFNDIDTAVVGPLAQGSNMPYLPPVWVARPDLLGPSVIGQTIALSGGYCVGNPHPTVTRQWVRSDDGWDTWSVIAGETGASYTIDEDDEGYSIGCISYADGVSTVSALSAVVPPYVPPPEFEARGVTADGTAALYSGSVSILAGNTGAVSLWFKSDSLVWNDPPRVLFSALISGSAQINASTSSSGRLSVRVNNDTSTDLFTVHAAPGNTRFQVGRWYHFAASWSNGFIRVFIDGVQMASIEYTSVDMNGQSINRFGVFAGNSTGSWVGSIGHFWLDLDCALDFSVPADLAKFIADGKPVDLGVNGEIPLGLVPDVYCDGPPEAWVNNGSAGVLPQSGTLTASDAPELP